MPHDVFISHSSKDKLIADAVCARLEAANIRCWIAPRDITPGSSWSEAIIDAIESTRVLVLIFTAHSNASPQVQREVERAISRGRIVLPLRLERVVMSKSLEYFISSKHWLDAMTPPIEQHLQTLADQLRRVLAMPAEKRPAPRRRHRPRIIVAAVACAAIGGAGIWVYFAAQGKVDVPVAVNTSDRSSTGASIGVLGGSDRTAPTAPSTVLDPDLPPIPPNRTPLTKTGSTTTVVDPPPPTTLPETAAAPFVMPTDANSWLAIALAECNALPHRLVDLRPRANDAQSLYGSENVHRYHAGQVAALRAYIGDIEGTMRLLGQLPTATRNDLPSNRAYNIRFDESGHRYLATARVCKVLAFRGKLDEANALIRTAIDAAKADQHANHESVLRLMLTLSVAAGRARSGDVDGTLASRADAERIQRVSAHGLTSLKLSLGIDYANSAMPTLDGMRRLLSDGHPMTPPSLDSNSQEDCDRLVSLGNLFLRVHDTESVLVIAKTFQTDANSAAGLNAGRLRSSTRAFRLLLLAERADLAKAFLQRRLDRYGETLTKSARQGDTFLASVLCYAALDAFAGDHAGAGKQILLIRSEDDRSLVTRRVVEWLLDAGKPLEASEFLIHPESPTFNDPRSIARAMVGLTTAGHEQRFNELKTIGNQALQTQLLGGGMQPSGIAYLSACLNGGAADVARSIIRADRGKIVTDIGTAGAGYAAAWFERTTPIALALRADDEHQCSPRLLNFALGAAAALSDRAAGRAPAAMSSLLFDADNEANGLRISIPLDDSALPIFRFDTLVPGSIWDSTR